MFASPVFTMVCLHIGSFSKQDHLIYSTSPSTMWTSKHSHYANMIERPARLQKTESRSTPTGLVRLSATCVIGGTGAKTISPSSMQFRMKWYLTLRYSVRRVNTAVSKFDYSTIVGPKWYGLRSDIKMLEQ